MKKILIALAVVVLVAFAAPVFAATNPFMDVPASHWAYDAVAQLAARGVISGYPDGTFKGPQPTTRYELASLFARGLAKIDIEKASKQDVELLKKLIVEFKDELDALGVRVDRIDERLAVLEDDLGGWRLWGEFDFRAKFTGDNDLGYYDQNGKNEFDMDKYRVYLSKRIDEKTTFTARLGAVASNNKNTNVAVEWDQYYITTKLGYDITFIAGNQPVDWEGDLGLYNDDEPFFGDWNRNAFQFIKNWGIADLTLLIARFNDDGWDETGLDNWINGLGNQANWTPEYLTTGLGFIEWTLYGAKINFNFNEKAFAGLLGYYRAADEDLGLDIDYSTFGIYAGFKFTPAIELKGIYYFQNQGEDLAALTNGGVFEGQNGYDDSANAWKVILDVDQDALKFTSLWLEYAKIDNNFLLDNEPYAYNSNGLNVAGIGDADSTKSVIFAAAKQQWNDRWSTFERYVNVDFDVDGIDDATNWTFGVGYQYTPAILFQLAYDSIDFGDDLDDHLINFRTYVTF
jgi:hypothetical protein